MARLPGLKRALGLRGVENDSYSHVGYTSANGRTNENDSYLDRPVNWGEGRRVRESEGE